MRQRNNEEVRVITILPENDISIMNLGESISVMNLDESRPGESRPRVFETGPLSYRTVTWIPHFQKQAKRIFRPMNRQ